MQLKLGLLRELDQFQLARLYLCSYPACPDVVALVKCVARIRPRPSPFSISPAQQRRKDVLLNVTQSMPFFPMISHVSRALMCRADGAPSSTAYYHENSTR